MPEHYFPGVEYPINILEASKPFYVITGENNAFTPFTDDVIMNFNSALIKPPIMKTSTDILSEDKLKTIAPKSMLNKTIDPETISSINTKSLPNLDNDVRDIFSKDSLTEQEVTSQEAISTHKKSNVKSEKNNTSVNSQEYYNYEDTYNGTDFPRKDNTDFDVEVQVYSVDEVLNDCTFINNVSEVTSSEDVVL